MTFDTNELLTNLRNLTTETSTKFKPYAAEEFKRSKEFWGPAITAILKGVHNGTTTIEDAEGPLSGYLALLSAEKRLDSLTQIWNRTALEELIPGEIDHALKHNEPLTMAMVDLDRFKRFNDQYDHSVGDRILEAFVRRVEDNLPDGIFGRYGGEEFILLLKNTTLDKAQIALEALRSDVELNLKSDAQKATGIKLDDPITISVGFDQCKAGDTFRTIFQRIDSAAYEAKGRNDPTNIGRNKIIMWNDKIPMYNR